MRARVPADVDLEDRLVYGLSPVRFGYVVVAALAAMSALAMAGAPAVLRFGAAAAAAVAGAGLAWGRWRGRPADAWLADIAGYVLRNYELEVCRVARTPRLAPQEEPPCASPGLDRSG